jgi:hypothetical protein
MVSLELSFSTTERTVSEHGGEAAGDGEAPICVFCLQPGTAGLPLVRICACRGPSTAPGFQVWAKMAHTACIVGAAEFKPESWAEMGCETCGRSYFGEDSHTQLVSPRSPRTGVLSVRPRAFAPSVARVTERARAGASPAPR